MTSLLLIISFLIHIIILIAIFQLVKQIQQVKQFKDKETETMMLQFLNEIKAENKQLQEQLTREQNQTGNDQLHHEQIKTSATPQTKSDDEISEIVGTDMQMTDLVENKQEQMELSMEGKVLQLNEEGYSTEAIAEKLTCGKTEVELILNLQQKLKLNT